MEVCADAKGQCVPAELLCRAPTRGPVHGLARVLSCFWRSVRLIVLIRDLFDNPLLFAQIVLSGLRLGFVYAMIALGYTMVYGIVKLINFAHGDVFMVGAFVSFYAVARFQVHLWPNEAFHYAADVVWR